MIKKWNKRDDGEKSLVIYINIININNDSLWYYPSWLLFSLSLSMSYLPSYAAVRVSLWFLLFYFFLSFSSVGVNVFRKACIALFYEHSIFLKLKARWAIYCHFRWPSLPPLLHFLDAFLPFVLLLYRTMGSRCFACLFVFHTMWTRFALLRFICIFFFPPLFFFVYVTNLRVCVFAGYNIRICIKRTAI